MVMLCLHHLHRTYSVISNSRRVVKCLPIANAGKKIRRQLFSSLSSGVCPGLVKRYENISSSLKFETERFRWKSSAADERTQKAVENEEFRDVLRDFARDFGVTEDSLTILEDIRKEQETGDSKDDDEKKNPESGKSAITDETVAAYRSVTKDRFKVFKDEDASVIHSYEEEMQLKDNFFHIDQKDEEEEETALPKRGITGVYDIAELVAVLKEENLRDIAVISVPPSFHYVDYIVLANAKSPKHAKTVSEYIVKFYKRKKNKDDPFVKIEGEKYGSWNAIDMGNIALHIFLEETRHCYDIESLWLLDSKYDTGGQVQQDDFTEIMKEELEFFNCIQAQDTLDSNVELLK